MLATVFLYGGDGWGRYYNSAVWVHLRLDNVMEPKSQGCGVALFQLSTFISNSWEGMSGGDLVGAGGDGAWGLGVSGSGGGD